MRGSFPKIALCLALMVSSRVLNIDVGRGGAAAAAAQEPAGGRGAPLIQQFNRTPPVDKAAHERGRALWAVQCVECHGAQARGAKGPNIIRSKTVNFDRSSEQAGSVLGPFLKAGHPTQSGKPSASFTNDEVVALANFLRQRVTDTMRWSPLFAPGNILVGDSRAGEAYFRGEGGCATCHNASTRSLDGIASRIDTAVDLQQRMLFPSPGRGARGAGSTGRGVNRNATTVTITPTSGAVISGVLVEESEFYVTLRDDSGRVRAVRRTPGMQVTKHNPMQAHIDLLDRITDEQIHDLVAYLETLK
jgi:mono/diheme cytochrome c family protein